MNRALITGAGRGIGQEIVRQLVATNTKVVAMDILKDNLDSLKKELPSIETVCCDISDWEQTKTVVESLGPINLLVNNAGYAELARIGSIDEKCIDKHFNINVKAVINITQIVTNGMKTRGTGGSIVNVSSVAGLIGMRFHSVYGASKAAMDLLTKAWALELGEFNIRVNSVNPTVTMTEMYKVNWSDPAVRESWLKEHPLGRFNKCDDVVNTIVHLLSDKANNITGVIIPIDAGLTCH